MEKKLLPVNINKDLDNESNNEDDDILIAAPSHFSKEETLHILLEQTPNSSSKTIFKINPDQSLIQKHIQFFPNGKKYSLTCGLIIRLKSLLPRIVKQRFQKAPPCCDGDSYMNRLYNIINHFVIKIDNNIWTKEILWNTAISLSEKHSVLPPILQKELCLKRLIMKDYPNDKSLYFDKEFLIKVANYYEDTKRPEGTFECTEDQNIITLSSLNREQCPICNGSRQVYCGPCGVCLPSAIKYMPKKISLPFDLLLILHWHETLLKCTGVQASVLCEDNTLSVIHWARDEKDAWKDIVENFNSHSDVLLFPSPNATSSKDFNWQDIDNNSNESNSSNSNISSNNNKWRLIVLEASWECAKTMAKQIESHRKSKGLLPLKCCCLEGITGQYWKYQNEGHAAVSTIEAIAYTAYDAGLNEFENDLLLLFKLQKYRVINRIKHDGKPTRAIHVLGAKDSSNNESKSWNYEIANVFHKLKVTDNNV